MNNETSSNEIWKPVKGFQGLYEVSNLGRVKSCERDVVEQRLGKLTPVHYKERIMRPNLKGKGYPMVQFGRCGKFQAVHHLVLEAFVRNRRGNECANHINGIKTDNRVENLEWTTITENNRHARIKGLNTGNKGRKWKQLTPKQIDEIRSLYGKELTCRLAEKYGVSNMTISRIGLKQTFKKI